MYCDIQAFCLAVSLWACTLLLGALPPRCAAEGDQPDSGRVVAHKETDGFELTVATAKQRFAPCEPIVAEVMLSNVTNSVQSVEGFGMKNDYGVTVTDKDGKKVSRTRYGESTPILIVGGGNRRVSTLEPGQAIKGQITVNRIYDMTMSGNYNITIRHAPFPRQGRQGLVHLTPVTIEVEVADYPPFREAQSP